MNLFYSGGFPALIEQLQLLRGSVEPVILDHDPIRWADFLKSSGRDLSQKEKEKSFGADDMESSRAEVIFYFYSLNIYLFTYFHHSFLFFLRFQKQIRSVEAV
jgi:hypothetical protein